MLIYIICIVICLLIIIANGIAIFHSVKHQIWSELFIHTGFIFYFCLLTIELTIGNEGIWSHFNIQWLKVVGFILYIPSAIFVISALISLKHKGKAESKIDPTASTKFIDTGIYGIVRQPLTLGMAIWSVALIFVFQSYLSLIPGLIALFCFWMSARKEHEYNIKKFGVVYQEYMNKVPMWNFFRGLTTSGKLK